VVQGVASVGFRQECWTEARSLGPHSNLRYGVAEPLWDRYVVPLYDLADEAKLDCGGKAESIGDQATVGMLLTEHPAANQRLKGEP